MADGIGLAEGQETTRARGTGRSRKSKVPDPRKPTGFEEDIECEWDFGPWDHRPSGLVVPERADFILEQGASLAAQRAADDMRQKADGLLPFCESPIEKVFLAALIAESQFDRQICFPYHCHVAKDPFDFVQNRMEDYLESMMGLCGPSPTGVISQVPIEGYRVDFLLFAINAHGPEREGWLRVKLVVECDGHDFHEKTKEQAKRDKARDRHLMKLGYHVMRFTGSEIWNNPRKCVLETSEFIHRLQGQHDRERFRRWRELGQ